MDLTEVGCRIDKLWHDAKSRKKVDWLEMETLIRAVLRLYKVGEISEKTALNHIDIVVAASTLRGTEL